MVQDIKNAMRQDIDAAPWMSGETKKAAMVKLEAVVDRIGYPDEWRDYSSIRVTRDDALGNRQRALMFNRKRNLAKIGQPVDRAEWSMTPPTVNAYYSPDRNNINFPAGILQPPFYRSGRDAAVNYGAAGAVIGHELTHGFDDQGRKFDGQGNLRDWWTPADGKAYEERATCVADQYSGYAVDGDTHVNGRLTLGENTADNGGLRLALMAYLAGPGAKNSEQDRRLHAGAAGLPRLGAGLVRKCATGSRAAEGGDQPALVEQVPRQRADLEHAGVPEGVLVQGERADGADERVPGVVIDGAGWAGWAGSGRMAAGRQAAGRYGVRFVEESFMTRRLVSLPCSSRFRSRRC